MTTQLSPEVLGILEIDEKETKPIVPVQAGLNKTPDEKDFNFWTTLDGKRENILKIETYLNFTNLKVVQDKLQRELQDF
jgi:hypothetical protein